MDAALPPRPLALERPVVLLLVIVSALGLLSHARRQVQEALVFRQELAEIPVVAPEGAPAVSQESIDLAMVMYGIQVPPTAEHPALDRDLMDRGLTVRATFMDKAKVSIGPAAFSSWGLLGSTLAHELEVHCQQNFLAIWTMDLLGLDGTGTAERQAYAHELRNAQRFGLDIADAELIADTVDHYYPETSAVRELVPRGMRVWLAGNILSRSQPF